MKTRVLAMTMLLISISSVAEANYPQPAYCSRGELTPTEVTVCGDPELSRLDLKLSEIIENSGQFDSDCEPTDSACLEAEAAAKATEANTD